MYPQGNNPEPERSARGGLKAGSLSSRMNVRETLTFFAPQFLSKAPSL
jgi:hypothetical protein